MSQIVLFRHKITYFGNSGTKLQLFFHICKRTRDFSVILAEKKTWYAFCSCVYELFFVPLQPGTSSRRNGRSGLRRERRIQY